jgi:spermidine synthase
MLEYTTLAFCGLFYNPEPKKVLVVGLGGGVIPRELHHYFPELEIDVVEIDPEIQIIAKQFFSFHEANNLRVHIADGRMFIKKQLRLDPVPKYDIVILDAFNSDYIPFHLMTKEFLEEVKGVLADDGAVISNVFYNNRLFDAELKTFLAVFGRCQVFLGDYSTNAMLVSPGPTGPMLTPKEAIGRAKLLQRKHRLAFSLPKVAMRLRPNIRPDSQAKVLTDDRAPVNWLRTQKRRKPPNN